MGIKKYQSLCYTDEPWTKGIRKIPHLLTSDAVSFCMMLTKLDRIVKILDIGRNLKVSFPKGLGLYTIICHDCISSYICQTGRSSEVRFKDRVSTYACLERPLTETRHIVSLIANNVKVLHREKEMIILKRLKYVEP